MQALIAQVGGAPVTEFRLVAFGAVDVHSAVEGRSFTFTRAHAEQAAAWFARANRNLVIDYEHQTIARLNTRADGLRPAAGWIGGVEVRDDGLWATKVEWTDRAAAMLRSGEYRYFSPVIYWSDEAYTRVDELGAVALTNDPAMGGVASLVASRRSVLNMSGVMAGELAGIVALLDPEGGDKSIDELLAAVTESNRARVAAALGLDASASIEEVRMKLRTLLSPGSGDGAGGGGNRGGNGSGGESGSLPTSQVSTLAREIGLEGSDWTQASLVSVLRAERSTVAAEREELKRLRARVAELEAKDAAREFDTIIASKDHAGKIPPAAVEEFRAVFVANRKAFDAMIAKMPVLAGHSELERGGDGGDGDGGGESPPERHEYLRKIDAVVASRKCSRWTAIEIVKRENPELYKNYTGHAA